jgi:transcriptional regulator with XRE-family HTH domain
VLNWLTKKYRKFTLLRRISKVENERLHFGDYPSEKFIHRLASELNADEDELLLLADKVPESMPQRIRERPDAIRAFAMLDDRTMDELLTRRWIQRRQRGSNTQAVLARRRDEKVVIIAARLGAMRLIDNSILL